MIIPSSPQVKRMLQYVGRPLALLFGFDLAIVIAYNGLHWEWVALPHIPLSLYGSAIGLIVAFRNNSAYGRWWEARKLWGSIVNNSRSLTRQALTALRPASETDAPALREMQRKIVHHQIAYVHALRNHLRQLDPWTELTPLLDAEEIIALKRERNVPFALQRRLAAFLSECLDRRWIDPLQWRALDESLNDLIDAQGGAERIKNTPMPKQYDYFPRLFVQIYCVLLPLALVTDMGWFTPLGSTLVGFMFLALDQIGRDLEDPFENTIFDIPLTAITRTIEIDLRLALGETDVPSPEKPIRGVLW